MRNILSLIVFSLLLLLTGCTKCSDDNKTETEARAKESAANRSVAKTTADVEKDANAKEPAQAKPQMSQNYEDVKIDLYIPGEALSPDELTVFLPENIPGTKRSQPSKGVIYGETGNVSTVSFTYDFGKGGLLLRIADYGTKDNIDPYDLKYFNVLPSRPGFELETIIDDMGKGYLLWSVEQNSGELYYLLANRFIIKVEGFSVPEGTGGLVYFFDMIKRKELLKKIKNS